MRSAAGAGRFAGTEHEHTQHVAAPPDRVFAALADVGNLPRYVPQITHASRGDGERVTIEARYEGHVQLFVSTVHGDAPDHEVMGTLDAIRRLVEADV